MDTMASASSKAEQPINVARAAEHSPEGIREREAILSRIRDLTLQLANAPEEQKESIQEELAEKLQDVGIPVVEESVPASQKQETPSAARIGTQRRSFEPAPVLHAANDTETQPEPEIHGYAAAQERPAPAAQSNGDVDTLLAGLRAQSAPTSAAAKPSPVVRLSAAGDVEQKKTAPAAQWGSARKTEDAPAPSNVVAPEVPQWSTAQSAPGVPKADPVAASTERTGTVVPMRRLSPAKPGTDPYLEQIPEAEQKSPYTAPVVPVSTPRTTEDLKTPELEVTQESPAPAPEAPQAPAEVSIPVEATAQPPVPEKAVTQDFLMSPEVWTGVEELLQAWPAFQASETEEGGGFLSFLGMGEKKAANDTEGAIGAAHPLYQQIAPLPVADVLAGKWGADVDPSRVASVQSWIEGWTEEGISQPTPEETFEHYLRRVVATQMQIPQAA